MLTKQSQALCVIALLAVGMVLTRPVVAGPAQSVVFATLQIGSQSGIRTRSNVVARTQAQWRTLWQQHTGGSKPRPPLPPIDFSQEMVIGVFAGASPARTRITIETVTALRNQLSVTARAAYDPTSREFNLAGGPDSPYHIVRVPRSSLKVVFVTH